MGLKVDLGIIKFDIPTIDEIAQKLLRPLAELIEGIGKGIAHITKEVVKGVLKFLDTDIGKIILLIIAVAVAYMTGAFNYILPILQKIGANLKGKIAQLFGSFNQFISGFTSSNLPKLVEIVNNIIGKVKTVENLLKSFITKYKPVLQLIEDIKDKKVIKVLYDFIHLTDRNLANVIDNLILKTSGFVKGILITIRQVFRVLDTKISDVILSVSNIIKYIQTIAEAFGLKNVVKIGSDISDVLYKIKSKIQEFVKSTENYISGLMNYVRKPLYDAYVWVLKSKGYERDYSFLLSNRIITANNMYFPVITPFKENVFIPKWVKEWWRK